MMNDHFTIDKECFLLQQSIDIIKYILDFLKIQYIIRFDSAITSKTFRSSWKTIFNVIVGDNYILEKRIVVEEGMKDSISKVKMIHSFIQLADGKIILVVTDDYRAKSGYLKICDPNTWKCEHTFPKSKYDKSVFHDYDLVCQLNDGRIISGFQSIDLIDFESNTFQELFRHQDYHNRTEYSGTNVLYQLHDGRVITADSNDFKIWNNSTWKCEKIVEGFCIDKIIQLQDHRLITSSKYPKISLIVWDVSNCKENPKQIHVLMMDGELGKIECFCPLKDGRLICGMEYHGGMLIYHTETWIEDKRLWDDYNLDVWFGHTDRVSCLHQLADGRLISGSMEKLLIWDIKTWEVLRCLQGYPSLKNGIMELKESNQIITVGGNMIEVWSKESR